jgi:hypothetical protein
MHSEPRRGPTLTHATLRTCQGHTIDVDTAVVDTSEVQGYPMILLLGVGELQRVCVCVGGAGAVPNPVCQTQCAKHSVVAGAGARGAAGCLRVTQRPS